MRGPFNLSAKAKHKANVNSITGADATITLDADPNEYHVLRAIQASYSDPAASGTLRVTIGSAVDQFEIDLAGMGPFLIDFPGGLYNGEDALNEQMVIMLTGSAGHVGKLNIQYY